MGTFSCTEAELKTLNYTRKLTVLTDKSSSMIIFLCQSCKCSYICRPSSKSGN